MVYDISIKKRAIGLRQNGYSIKEIARKLNIAQSSSSLWVRNTQITDSGKSRMIRLKEVKRYKMSQAWVAKREQTKHQYQLIAQKIIETTALSPAHLKIICATLFWAEGSKGINHIGFTNSDPLMITTFLYILRQAYIIDESKFHVSIHLHEYHDAATILKFWSDLTSIPLSQFIKPYLKPHTAIRKKDNYMGCITIRYYDHKIARELTAIYNALGEQCRGVVQW